MKKTGMFLAVLLVASLFASSFALAESFALTGKAVGLDSNSGASISAEELVPSSLSSSDIEESISNVDDSIGNKPAFPGHTSIGNGWMVVDDKKAVFVHGVWTERKTSDGELVSFGKLRVGTRTFKLEKVESEWSNESIYFKVYGHEIPGEAGKLSLELTEQIGHMKFWKGVFYSNSYISDGITGDVTLATATNRIKRLPKPGLTTESGPTTESGSDSPNLETESGETEIPRKPTLTDEASDNTAEDEKKGFLWRIRKFFGGK